MTDTTARPAPTSLRTASVVVTGQTSQKPKRISNASADGCEIRSQMLLEARLAFRDGDFSCRMPSDWAGTEDRIAEAFNQAIAHEDRISREVERLSITVGQDGRLRQRMSLPDAIGQWAAKVEFINTLIDDLVRPTAEIARTIGAVAKGDLGQSMELEADGRGPQGRLPSFREAREYYDRAAIGLHVGSNSRGAGGRYGGQTRRSGSCEGRLRRMERPHGFRQSDGRKPHRSGAQHCRGDDRGRERRSLQKDHSRTCVARFCSSRRPPIRWSISFDRSPPR